MQPVRSGFIFALAAALLLCFGAAAQELSELQRDLRVVTGEIAAAERMVASPEPAPVREIARMRLEVLRLTKALLENRIQAVRADADTSTTVPAVAPRPDLAANISQTAKAAGERGEDAALSANLAAGAQRELALRRAETERLAAAQLRIALYQAQYGFYIPASLDDVESSWESAAATVPETYAWTDPRHPHVDYSHPLFRMAYEQGATISGWWTVASTASNVFASNVSDYRPEGGASGVGAQLHIKCLDGGATAVAVFLPGIVLAADAGSDGAQQRIQVDYRIDNGSAASDVWNAEYSGQAAEVSGWRATNLVDRLRRARTLRIDATDFRGAPHSAAFDLAGIDLVASAVARTCPAGSAPIPPLTRSDYRLIQQLLNVAGFTAGLEDGIWGANSGAALARYQQSAGIPATGEPDQATLQLLGLID